MPGFFFAGDGATRALAGTRVGAGALTADGQTATVTQTLVGADLDLAADVGLDLATEVTLGLDVVVHELADRDKRSSLRSRTRVFGSTPVAASVCCERVRPMPNT